MSPKYQTLIDYHLTYTMLLVCGGIVDVVNGERLG